MLKTIKNFLLDTSAAIAPLMAVVLPLLLGMTGVGIDAGYWMQNKRDMQAAADAAAIAAGYEYLNEFTQAEAIAAGLKEAVRNGYNDNGVNEYAAYFSTDAEGDDVVNVRITTNEDKYFSQVLYQGDVSTTVVAAAKIVLVPSNFCLLALDESKDSALTAVGTVDVVSTGCGVAVNSRSSTALDLTGNVSVNISDLSVVGDMTVAANVDLETQSTRTNARAATDPYENVESPEFDRPFDCDYNNLSRSGTTTIPHTDSTGDGKVVYCGGITLEGNGTVTFPPGVYYMYAGDLYIAGNGTVNANGVTIVLTGSAADGYSNLDISGGKDMFFTAPADGALTGDEAQYEGISFYQDRRAPDDGTCNILTGTSALDLIGAAYFPSRCLQFGGNADDNSSQAEVCSRIVANQIVMHGTPHLGNDCEDVALPQSGFLVVRLIK